MVFAKAAESANIGGTLAARGRGTNSGKFINIFNNNLTLTQTSKLNTTNNVDGGFVTVDGSGDVVAHGRVDARGQSGNDGFILVKSAGDLFVGATSRMDAGGEIEGGFVSVKGEDDVAVHGQLLARGRTGNGGQIFVTGDRNGRGSKERGIFKERRAPEEERGGEQEGKRVFLKICACRERASCGCGQETSG